MFILGNLLIALGRVISIVANLYTFILACSVVLSWIKPDPSNTLVQIIYNLTWPVLNKVRRFVPSFLWKSGIDFTPVLVMILLIFLETLVSGTLIDTGLRLKNR